MTDRQLVETIERILTPFIEESLPEGGIDIARSPWQKPGKGSASGSNMFPGKIDVRYLRYLVEVLYRMAELAGRSEYRKLADAHAGYMASAMREEHPTWAFGNALETIGLYHRYNPPNPRLSEAAGKMLEWSFKRRIQVTTVDGVTFDHFPCGYKILSAKDGGWSNDLSIFGSGLIWAYEVSRKPEVLDAAASFSEFFIQGWKPGSLGPDGYWRCGTWRDDLGTWVIGPAHYSGFESTDAYADEAGWVFSAFTCIDYLSRLHGLRPDERLVDRCLKGAEWTFASCQFDDGAIGICGRDDKWLGTTGDAISLVALLSSMVDSSSPRFTRLLERARASYRYLSSALPCARMEDHGVEWAKRTTSTDPLVNVAMGWLSALLGLLYARELWPQDRG